MKKKFEAKDWLRKEQEKPVEKAPVARVVNNDPYDDIEVVTRRIEDAGVDITVGYAAWRDVGFALSDALGEAGRQYYHRVSCLNPDYNKQECDKQYDKCLKAHGTGVTVKTFFQLAKDAGVSVSIPSKTSKPSIPSLPRNEGSGVIEVSKVEEEEEEILPSFSAGLKGTLPGLLERVLDTFLEETLEDGEKI